MKVLVGFTGFVGSNLQKQTHFDGLYNSANIAQAFHTNPDILIYSGVPSEKFLANSDPGKDFNSIENAIENIKKINPKKIILISTVDVYPTPIHVDETEDLSNTDNQAYGKNRLYLEHWVEANFKDHLIVRLPALFGTNLRKNFIYDLIQIIPAMLNEKKFAELSQDNPLLNDYYTRQENTFYKLNPISDLERKQLKQKFHDLNFTALNFTDSRGVFQFYNLDHLWHDIEIALDNHIKKLNLATEPVSVNEIYTAVFNKPFNNEILPVAPMYDFHTIYSKHFGGLKNYIRSKEIILADIKKFIAQATQ
jgi:hypothetical protein